MQLPQDTLTQLSTGVKLLRQHLRGAGSDSVLSVLKAWLAEVEIEIDRLSFCPVSGLKKRSAHEASDGTHTAWSGLMVQTMLSRVATAWTITRSWLAISRPTFCGSIAPSHPLR